MPTKKSKKTKSQISAAQWRKIRLFAMDVDGILTDGSLIVSSDGTESKTFSILDGAGLIYLGWAGITTAWLSGRKSGATTVRAKDLKIPYVVQGQDDKLAELKKLAAKLKLTADQIVYMGDDAIDAPAIKWAGIGISVSNAQPPALAAADIITKKAAGAGAVREICNCILAAHGK
ncbi:KdsC family phosphatase [Ereboglobus luteus]|uniref:HAD family hydrolase n=1 Tax=Ereboglobus luteus TaxID=1796921 RepID=A0A2U8E6D4_9BACT|nr:HAD hydrolase family protein [Ereboglobus luteus]AWI10380.1 HAD family hydrolase [Ereboglobus luteus]